MKKVILYALTASMLATAGMAHGARVDIEDMDDTFDTAMQEGRVSDAIACWQEHYQEDNGKRQDILILIKKQHQEAAQNKDFAQIAKMWEKCAITYDVQAKHFSSNNEVITDHVVCAMRNELVPFFDNTDFITYISRAGNGSSREALVMLRKMFPVGIPERTMLDEKIAGAQGDGSGGDSTKNDAHGHGSWMRSAFVAGGVAAAVTVVYVCAVKAWKAFKRKKAARKKKDSKLRTTTAKTN